MLVHLLTVTLGAKCFFSLVTFRARVCHSIHLISVFGVFLFAIVSSKAIGAISFDNASSAVITPATQTNNTVLHTVSAGSDRMVFDQC